VIAQGFAQRLSSNLAPALTRGTLGDALARTLAGELEADLVVAWLPTDPLAPRPDDVHVAGRMSGQVAASEIAAVEDGSRLVDYVRACGLDAVLVAECAPRVRCLLAAWAAAPAGAADRATLLDCAAALADTHLETQAIRAELHGARRTLQEAQTQIALTRRARVVGELASGIVHDFNNCLTTVIGFTELALGALDETSTCHADLKTIRLAAMDAATLVKRLQTMGRGSDEERCVVDVREIAKAMPELVRPRWTRRAQLKGVTFDIVVDAQAAPPVYVVVGEIRELLMNLLFNAIDAMPSGGRITISTRCTDGRAEVLVRDEGTGIAREVQEKLFQPFTSTKGTAGSGLGLSVCRSIAERHEGTLTAQSALGRGTTFVLSLPAAPRRLAPAAPSGEQAAAEAARLEPEVRPASAAIGRRILLVDDQQEVRDSVGEMLRALGHSVVMAGDGQAALAAAGSQPIDVVFTDFGMPEMNGAELGQRLAAVAPKTPVVLMSGWGLDDDVRLPGNVVHVLGKPLTLKTLEDALSRDGVLTRRIGS
jgi:signal transduction histidine kinase